MKRVSVVALAAVTACAGKPGAPQTLATDSPSPGRREEAPVATDPEIPVAYPASLAAQRLGGTVVLRLFVDSAGRLIPDSTSVQESSGYPALDSAAIAGIGRVHYAPAVRNGSAVSGAFLQPVTFKPPAGGSGIP